MSYLILLFSAKKFMKKRRNDNISISSGLLDSIEVVLWLCVLRLKKCPPTAFVRVVMSVSETLDTSCRLAACLTITFRVRLGKLQHGNTWISALHDNALFRGAGLEAEGLTLETFPRSFIYGIDISLSHMLLIAALIPINISAIR